MPCISSAWTAPGSRLPTASAERSTCCWLGPLGACSAGTLPYNPPEACLALKAACI